MKTTQIQNSLARITADPATATAAISAHISRLLAAPAPANSCALPGAVGDVIRAMASELSLPCAPIGSTGNLGITLGDPAAPLDLLITAHMDRPCFRVLTLPDATLYPLCAIRVPGDNYSCSAIALRYINDRVAISARGQLRFQETDDDYHITFHAESGDLAWGDTVMMHCAPKISDGLIIGTGLDNAIGVLLALLSAHALSKYAPDALAERKIIFAFTDQEEGPPIGLFGQGAARLAHALPPPRLGFINIDGHNLDQSAGHIPGIGASHAFVSGYGRGSVVPMDYQALAESLADMVNQARPNTVRLNHSYVSRSDDMLLAAWSRPLALAGVIVANAHTTEETAALADIASAAHWIPAFITAAFNH
ncbi:MAG: M20/M25/M40 family metallo-hydrolase [Chloroflexi bacterium]|nr:M20/M25/M40 family metallo-hydrolase [Chloroflexota bacterium]